MVELTKHIQVWYGIVKIVRKAIENGKKILKFSTRTGYMKRFPTLISEKIHEKIITINCNQVVKFIHGCFFNDFDCQIRLEIFGAVQNTCSP